MRFNEIKTKMKKVLLGLLLLPVIWSVGCQRSAGTVWEDTKTGGSYMGKGMRSVAGKHGSQANQPSSSQFTGPVEEEYIPLNNEDLYQKLVMGDTQTLQELNAYSAIPQSKEQPGELGSAIPGIDGFKRPSAIGLQETFNIIHFDTNDYVVRGKESREQIRKIAAYLKDNPNIFVFIEGNCDERGTAAYNQSLGSKRSNSVRALLVKEGVNLNRLFTISYGKERPIAMGHDSASLRMNRRAEFKIFSKKG